MAYKADEYCRRTGPVGNGASRGTGRHGEPGYFDDYGYFIPDPEPVDDSCYREQKAKQEELKAELRQRKQEEEAAQRRREVRSNSAPQPEDSGLGALPVAAGIFVGIAAAKAARERKRRMSPPSVAAPQKPPAKQDDTEGPLAVYCYFLITGGFIAVCVFGLLALFAHGSWLRFLGSGLLLFLSMIPLDKVIKWKP